MDIRFMSRGVAIKSAFSHSYSLWDVEHSVAWPLLLTATFDEYDMVLHANGVAYRIISQEELQCTIYQLEKTLATSGQDLGLARAKAALSMLQSLYGGE